MNLTKLDNRIIDDKGNVVYFTDALIELLYNGEIPSEILYPTNDYDIELFNKLAYENYDNALYSLPKEVESLEKRKNKWFYPENYDNINLEDYFLNLCQSDIEQNRVKLELSLYKEKGFEKFLRFCIYLSDKIKENNWVIGVGRGSSCNSFLLFLLQINLVNPLDYDLDIKEFLK